MQSSTQSAEALISRTLQLSTGLHDAIESFDDPTCDWHVSDQPGVAFFTMDGNGHMRHESGSPDPGLLEVLGYLHERHRAAVGLTGSAGNSHIPALLLLCLYVADEPSAKRIGLDRVLQRNMSVIALDEDEGRHEPQLGPYDAALRAWVPVSQSDREAALGPFDTVLEFRFDTGRRIRYAPW